MGVYWGCFKECLGCKIGGLRTQVSQNLGMNLGGGFEIFLGFEIELNWGGGGVGAV
jgi:hypothetical protein